MAKRKTIYLEYTDVTAAKSQKELLDVLGQTEGVSLAGIKEPRSGDLGGVDFIMTAGDAEARYFVAVEPARVAREFRKQGRRCNDAQTERIAWRQTLYWVKAQIAMVQLGLIRRDEAFLPYMLGASGQTFFEEFTGFRDKQIKAAQ